MSVIGSNILAGASGQGGGYNLTNSLRFRSSASAYLNRTPASAGNRQTWTWSMWVKRGSLGSAQNIFAANGVTDTTYLDIRFTSSDTIQVGVYNDIVLVTTQVFRDPSAWYHIVWLFDTTQASASNRCRLFVNGSEITAFSTDSRSTYFAQNTNYGINNNTLHEICRNPSDNSKYLDGYLAEVNFVNGQALTPSSFGETSTTTGVWIPKKYTGTYGTNGFYLPFTDNSALTTSSNVGLGKDFSGNGNYFATNGISLTAGSTYDSMTDVPTLTSATAANYCVLNPLMTGSFATLSNANLTITGNTATNSGASIGSMASTTGKFYWELVCTNVATTALGVGATTVQLTSSALNDAEAYATNYGFKVRSSGSKEGISGEMQTFTMPSFTTGDVIGIAVDADNGAIYVSKNGNYVNSGSPTSGASKTGSCYNYTPSSSRPIAPMYGAYINDVGAANFGQRPFAYTPPSGFLQLNTFNLPTPTIGATASTTANKYFDINLWTGNNANPRTLTGLSFQPDWVWLKDRSQATNHRLVDAVRGASKTLKSNTTDAETSSEVSGTITAFTSNGFTVEGTSNVDGVNLSGDAYVAWNWKANGTGSSNTAGSITSTVSANTSAGFSVVTGTFPASGTSCTFGHGLGVAPSMIISKGRDGGTSNWIVRHTSLENMTTKYFEMNNTGGVNTGSNAATAPSSTLASVSTDGLNNNMAFVAYCFAPIAGYSAFGSYTGNNASDGTFVYLGFRPKFIMIKSTSASTEWVMIDTSRSSYNLSDTSLYANRNYSESTIGTVDDVDILSNGFKLRNTTGFVNASQTYIYMAFAETPQKFALGR